MSLVFAVFRDLAEVTIPLHYEAQHYYEMCHESTTPKGVETMHRLVSTVHAEQVPNHNTSPTLTNPSAPTRPRPIARIETEMPAPESRLTAQQCWLQKETAMLVQGSGWLVLAL